MEDTDRLLMERVRKGDEKAFEMLVARHQRMVYSLACRFMNDEHEADDIAQETFIRVYRAASSYVPTAKFSTWLYTIVRNLCFNAIRKRNTARILPLDDEAVPEPVSPAASQLEVLLGNQIRDRIAAAVAKLPENMRLAVLLHKFNGMQYDEIAEIFQCSVNAVKLRVHRAKAILAAELGDLKDET
ncbi:MAG: RNA polymerase sigma factor RpoE [Thermodesulfovibrionales bacterium]